MKKEDKIILSLSFAVLVSVLIASVITNIRQDAEIKDLRHRLWVYNWSPTIDQRTIENITYHFVLIGDYVAFVSPNATEAMQWAIDYSEEWGWVWER